MSKKEVSSAERILSAGQRLFLQAGFVGTSLDDIVLESGLTKGAFFHYYRSKLDLGQEVLRKYWEARKSLFTRLWKESAVISDDPLKSMLLFLKTYEEKIRTDQSLVSGCLFASFLYEGEQFPLAVHEYINNCFLDWKQIVTLQIEKILKKYPAALPVKAEELALLYISIEEGGFVLGRTFENKMIRADQIRQFAQYLTLLFSSNTSRKIVE